MPEELERAVRYGFILLAKEFGPWGVFYAALAIVAVAALWWGGRALANSIKLRKHEVAGLVARPKDALRRYWRHSSNSWWRPYLPVFAATYLLAAGIAILLDRFGGEAAFIACPVIAAAVSYLFNRHLAQKQVMGEASNRVNPLGVPKPEITICELAAIMFQAVIDPQAECRDWEIVKGRLRNRERFRTEWFCFRSFITLSIAESVLDGVAWQALIDTYFGTLPGYAPAKTAALQVTVTHYVNVSNSGTTRLQYGTIADVCMEFSRLCSGKKNDPVLTSFADITAFNFGRDQLTRLCSFELNRDSFVVAEDGSTVYNG
jgi:hypothetical protein